MLSLSSALHDPTEGPAKAPRHRPVRDEPEGGAWPCPTWACARATPRCPPRPWRRSAATPVSPIPLSETPRAPLHAWEVRRAIEEVTANRRAFADRLAEARAWEIEVIEGREAVLDRMLALA
jgi:hypothetical protein